MLYEDCQPPGPRTATYQVLSALEPGLLVVFHSSSTFLPLSLSPAPSSFKVSAHLTSSQKVSVARCVLRSSRAARRDNFLRERVMILRRAEISFVDAIALKNTFTSCALEIAVVAWEEKVLIFFLHLYRYRALFLIIDSTISFRLTEMSTANNFRITSEWRFFRGKFWRTK